MPHRRIHRTNGVVALGLLAIILHGCGGGNTPSTAGQPTPAPATTNPTAGPVDSPGGATPDIGGGQEGSATVDADGVETTLNVDDCTLVAGAVVIVATTSGASLSMAGTGGAASIEFTKDGAQWLAAGAPVTVDGSTVRYDGPASKVGGTPGAASLEIEVRCDS